MVRTEPPYIQSLIALNDSAQRLALSAERGDWDTVAQEIAVNTACFERLRALPPTPPLDHAERERARTLLAGILAANERSGQIISPRVDDVRQLLAALSN